MVVGLQSHAAAATLTIFHADSLSAYVSAVAEKFRATHPDLEVRREGSGSLDAIRKVSDLGKPCDLVITADARLLGEPHRGLAPWSVAFAGNSLGLLYTGTSAGADRIDQRNWYKVLLSNGVRYGHSNPERDPAGYWTLIAWQLAERFYHEPGLAAKLAASRSVAGIRPHNIDLIALLESGELDYYFGYASDARLGKLRFLALPDQINLSDPARAADYANAHVDVGTGERSKHITGAPIAYAVTMTSDPPNGEAAIEFLKLMFSAEGEGIARDSGLLAYPHPISTDPNAAMPPELRASLGNSR